MSTAHGMTSVRQGAVAMLAVALSSCAGAGVVETADRSFASAHVTASRLELTAVDRGGRYPSPFPISRLRVRLFAQDGGVYTTEAASGGTSPGAGGRVLSASDLTWRVNIGQFTPDLVYVPPIDVLPVVGGDLVVDVSVAKQPAVHARLAVKAQFDCRQFLDLSGRDGAAAYFSRPATPGEPGPAVQIALGYVNGPTQKPLVLVKVEDAAGVRARTVLSPDGPPLQIFLDGGAGGLGGGDGGDGGAALIVYEEGQPELEQRVKVFNRGGPAGAGADTTGRPGRQGAIPRTEPGSARLLFREEIEHGAPIRIHGVVDPSAKRSI
jgi:hypothetical protein